MTVQFKKKTILYVFLLLTTTSFDYILYLRWIQSMQGYTWLASAVVFPVFGWLFFLIPYLIKQHWQQRQRHRSSCIRSTNDIDPLEPSHSSQDFYRLSLTPPDDDMDEKKIKWYKLLYLGFFDSVNSMLGIYATPYLSVVLMTLVDKLAIPMTMIFSMIYFKRRYQNVHLIGSFLVIYGVLVKFLPDFIGAVNKNGESIDHQSQHLIWIAIYAASLIPGVASYCCKEHYLSVNERLDIWWVNVWISFWQVVIGLIVAPIILTADPGLIGKEASMGKYITNGLSCQFGGCSHSIAYMLGYQAVSTICNILMFLLIREESAVVYMILSTLKMPITAWLGSYHTLVGPAAQSLGWVDLFSLVGISIGLYVYHLSPEK